jgi:hypothetical protein
MSRTGAVIKGPSHETDEAPQSGFAVAPRVVCRNTQ